MLEFLPSLDLLTYACLDFRKAWFCIEFSRTLGSVLLCTLCTHTMLSTLLFYFYACSKLSVFQIQHSPAIAFPMIQLPNTFSFSFQTTFIISWLGAVFPSDGSHLNMWKLSPVSLIYKICMLIPCSRSKLPL